MSLPIAGAMPPPTHKPVEPTKLMRIASDLEDAADDAGLDRVTLEFLEEHAEESGVPESHLLAALLASNIELERTCDNAFVVCAGKCQAWGALDHLEHLLERRRGLQSSGGQAPNFDVRVRSCLDRCDQAPAVAVETAGGMAVIPKATREALDEAIAQLVDE